MEKKMATHSSTLAWKLPWTEEPGRLQSMGLWRVGHNWATSLSLFTFMQKEMATHSSVLAWRIPGMAEPGELPSMGSHRVRHNWSDLAAATIFKFWSTDHATTWINLENIMLNERNQSQKATCCRIHFMWNVQNIEIQRTRKWISGCRELREVGFRQGVTANGHWISFWGDRDVLKLPSDDGFTTLWNTKNHWIVHFRRVHFMACELHINFF